MNNVTGQEPNPGRLAHLPMAVAAMLFSLALVDPAGAQSFTPIECPGYLESESLGMNDFGTIVGTCSNDLYETSSGYVRKGGVFTILDAPGSAYTEPWDVNNLGAVVGDYIGEDGNFHGLRPVS